MQENRYTRTSVDEDGVPLASEPNPVVAPARPAGPSRADRRRAARALKRERESRAFFATALDGKIHVVLFGRRKTICGRQGLTLAEGVSTRKNRCATCAEQLA